MARTNLRGMPDYFLLLVALTILSIGVIMVFSSSSVVASSEFGSPYYFLIRQMVWSFLGIGVMFFCLHFDYWHWRPLAPWVLGITLVCLLAVLVPHVGRAVNGSRRWIGIGPLLFQPSEMAKLTVVLYLAAWLSVRGARMHHFWETTAPALGMVGVLCGLILLEPDLGTAAALVATALVMLYVAGVPLRQLVLTAIAGIPILGAAIFASPYRRERLLGFLHPQANATTSGWHIIQGLYALGSGGLFGVGLGLSKQKYFYLPEPYTDFIFAILGEELGLIGGVLLLGLFLLLFWRGFRIAVAAPDTFGTILAASLTAMLAIQAVINLGVVMAVFPVTGIPLPLVSYGGSSLVFTLAGIGILGNISRYAR